MIFVTVGTQLGFDRLISTVLESISLDTDIYFQIGNSSIVPNFNHSRFLSSEEYYNLISQASLIIGHAGMGTIITSVENQIPCILMPRKKIFGEHRSDHQIATCGRFKDSYGVFVAESVMEMKDCIEKSATLDRNKIAKNNSSMAFYQELYRYIL